MRIHATIGLSRRYNVWQAGKVAEFKVEDMKGILRAFGLPVTGKKADLQVRQTLLKSKIIN